MADRARDQRARPRGERARAADVAAEADLDVERPVDSDRAGLGRV
jgi:hypothetical protein